MVRAVSTLTGLPFRRSAGSARMAYLSLLVPRTQRLGLNHLLWVRCGLPSPSAQAGTVRQTKSSEFPEVKDASHGWSA